MNKRPTQKKRIYDYMKQNRYITAYDAQREFGCMRLSARIAELKESGIAVGSEYAKVKNRYGEECSVKRYWLIEGENNAKSEN